MSIEIRIFGEDAGHALRELKDFAVGLPQGLPQGHSSAFAQAREIVSAEGKVLKSSFADVVENAATNEGQNAAPPRERGKPAAGRARRTKEEIAEDEAADQADAERDAGAKDAGIQADAAADVKPTISTGENRDHPEDPQDAADEAAEVEASRDAESPLTIDDIKKALGEYMQTFGMAAAQEDGPKVIKLALGGIEAPADASGNAQDWRMSLIPTDQDSLKKVLNGVTEMTTKNPYKRAPVNGVLA